MRRDLILGILISVLLHGGVLFGDKLIPDKKKVVRKEPPKTVIEIIEMPKIEPEEPEVYESSDEEVKPLDFAPPMQQDMPQIVTDTSFVQQMQPPPPEGLKPATGVIVIPGNRDVSNFRGMEIFDISKLDQTPQPTFRVAPQYPFEMRRAGISGEVLVEFLVDTAGNVQNPIAVRSTQREFENNAVQAVAKWRFKPGRKGGRAVVTRMQVPIVFTLNEE